MHTQNMLNVRRCFSSPISIPQASSMYLQWSHPYQRRPRNLPQLQRRSLFFVVVRLLPHLQPVWQGPPMHQVQPAAVQSQSATPPLLAEWLLNRLTSVRSFFPIYSADTTLLADHFGCLLRNHPDQSCVAYVLHALDHGFALVSAGKHFGFL